MLRKVKKITRNASSKTESDELEKEINKKTASPKAKASISLWGPLFLPHFNFWKLLFRHSLFLNVTCSEGLGIIDIFTLNPSPSQWRHDLEKSFQFFFLSEQLIVSDTNMSLETTRTTPQLISTGIMRNLHPAVILSWASGARCHRIVIHWRFFSVPSSLRFSV